MMNDTHSQTPAGVVNLCKPVGASSARYVYRLRPIFGIRKVGHAGTLDPFASGVLVGCVGRATKLVERLMCLPKHYRTTIRLGVTNETYDTEQPFQPVPDVCPPSRKLLDDVLRGFVGRVEQVPPAFSAVKIKGIPSYRLAQRGHAVPRKATLTEIKRPVVLDYEWPKLELDVHCGRGTYIRAIARDLGERLACGACCETLTRMAVGPFRIEQAVDIGATADSVVLDALIPIDEAVRRMEADANM